MAKVILEPQRLTELLEGYMRTSAERSEAAHAQLAKVRHGHKGAEAAITRLLGLVEQGIMDAGDPALRERLTGLFLQPGELVRQVLEQQKRLADGTPQLTPVKIKAVGSLLRDKLFEGPRSSGKLMPGCCSRRSPLPPVKSRSWGQSQS